MILRARWVVTMDGPPIENGAVVITGNKISGVGRWADFRASKGGEVVDLGEQVLLPGLINAHCHLDYTAFRGTISRQKSFTAWIRAINARKAQLTAKDYLASIAEGFAEAAAYGTTTIANLEGFPELLAVMPRPPLRTWWFAELIDVREAQSAAKVCEKMQAVFERNSDWLGGIGLAPHASFTASAKLYEEASKAAEDHGLALTTHLAESREEMEMFRQARGELFDFMEDIGRPMGDCGRATPLALMLERGALSERWLVAHLNELTHDDFRLLEAAPRFHVVHCPRSHAYFDHSPFALARLRGLGFNICLGTDSLASNGDLSLFAEMRQLLATQPTLLAREVLEMVTVNAAAALHQDHLIGRIRSGLAADLFAIPAGPKEAEIVTEIIAFEGRVPWLMVDGQERVTS
jgi:aminodeoxyfutalosine deaminase